MCLYSKDVPLTYETSFSSCERGPIFCYFSHFFFAKIPFSKVKRVVHFLRIQKSDTLSRAVYRTFSSFRPVNFFKNFCIQNFVFVAWIFETSCRKAMPASRIPRADNSWNITIDCFRRRSRKTCNFHLRYFVKKYTERSVAATFGFRIPFHYYFIPQTRSRNNDGNVP